MKVRQIAKARQVRDRAYGDVVFLKRRQYTARLLRIQKPHDRARARAAAIDGTWNPDGVAAFHAFLDATPDLPFKEPVLVDLDMDEIEAPYFDPVLEESLLLQKERIMGDFEGAALNPELHEQD